LAGVRTHSVPLESMKKRAPCMIHQHNIYIIYLFIILIPHLNSWLDMHVTQPIHDTSFYILPLRNMEKCSKRDIH
jgi:hypothetical protein